MTTTQNSNTVDIEAGVVKLDNLISALENVQEHAESQVQQFFSSENYTFLQTVNRAVEQSARNTAERVVLRNSVKRDIARRLAQELVENTTFMNMLAQKIIEIHQQHEESQHITNINFSNNIDCEYL